MLKKGKAHITALDTGQVLFVPDVTVEGWWTNLDLPEQKIMSLYQNHGLSEQFHSEFKTDLDLERLPSGKFATNALVMALGAFAYNILRFIGQLGLLGEKSPVRHPGKRRRIKTVIQELIYLAARLIRSGRRLFLRFSKHARPIRPFSMFTAGYRQKSKDYLASNDNKQERCAFFEAIFVRLSKIVSPAAQIWTAGMQPVRLQT